MHLKPWILVWLLLLCASITRANHIVGGEIELITLRAGTYRINLYQYWDTAQDENPIGNVDPQITISIFSKASGELIRNEILANPSVIEVAYTDVECSIEELQTAQVIWTGLFNWLPQEFTEPEGYLIVWERCCRNESVVNIVAPNEAGMKYILEIPPLWKNGKAFINSSPGLNKPIGDYACVDVLFYADFTATDSDGDSLVYRLATPLNSSSQEALPVPQPEPHTKVRWKSGFSENNIIPGSPALAISTSGTLTVRPSNTGLYGFSVEIEEWRKINGIPTKIGLVQRDFQLLVIDDCDTPPPPKLSVIIPGQSEFDPETDILSYMRDDEKCFQFLVENVGEGDSIRFTANPVNFEGDYVFFDNTAFVIGADRQLLVDYCAPDCPPLRDRPFEVDFMVLLDVCPLPQFDTLRMRIQVEPPFNQKAILDPIQDAYTINEEDEISFPFVATDADGDSIKLEIFYDDTLALAERGMFSEITLNEPGRVEGVFTWKTDCQLFDFSDRQKFKLSIQADDLDTCGYEDPAMELVDLSVILPTNNDPVLTAAVSDTVDLSFDDSLIISLKADDADGDTVLLRLATEGFNATAVGAQFAEQKGLSSVETIFSWTPKCEELNLLERSEFQFHFIAEDIDKCKVKNHDTVSVLVRLKIPENKAPVINKSEIRFELEVNELFELEVTAMDSDDDQVIMELAQPQDVPSGLRFSSASGAGSVSSVLSWEPDCGLLADQQKVYSVLIRAVDDACPFAAQDTFRIYLEIKETLDVFGGFDPPNVFTPNGDSKNQVFSCSGQVEARRNLPPDRCFNEFEKISIYNRSGAKVYQSSRRDFSWDGGAYPSGTYYYQIQYSKSEYKAYIHMLR